MISTRGNLFKGTRLADDLNKRVMEAKRSIGCAEPAELTADAVAELIAETRVVAPELRREMADFSTAVKAGQVAVSLRMPVDGEAMLLLRKPNDPAVMRAADVEARVTDHLRALTAAHDRADVWGERGGFVVTRDFEANASREQIREWAANLTAWIESFVKLLAFEVDQHNQTAEIHIRRAADDRLAAIERAQGLQKDLGFGI